MFGVVWCGVVWCGVCVRERERQRQRQRERERERVLEVLAHVSHCGN